MSSEVKISGDVNYPDVGTHWADNKTPLRSLYVREVEPGDRLGREIRGTVTTDRERDYATDIRTFEAVWVPLQVPVAMS